MCWEKKNSVSSSPLLVVASMRCVIVICCAVYCVVCGVGAGVDFLILCSVVSLSDCLSRCFVPVRFHKRSGSYVHVCLRPCSNTHRMGQALHPPKQWTTHCANCALVLPEPCYKRMCVIAKRLGSLIARTCSWTWSFLWRLHDLAHRFSICSRPFTL